MRTQTKIALIFFVFSLSIVIFLSGSIYYFTTQYSFDDFYKRLEIRAVVNARMLVDSANARSSILKEFREIHLVKLPNETDYFYEIVNEVPRLEDSQTPDVPPSFFKDVMQTGKAFYRNGNTFFSGIRFKGERTEYLVVVSADSYYGSHHLMYLRNIVIIGILVTAALTLFFSIMFSRMVFNPVKEITRKVKEIGFQNLSLRLSHRGGNDEIAVLEKTFNNMLDRLETVFAAQQSFISNASHELNTPLTAIIGQAEVALSKTRDPEEYVESLQIILTKAERLEQITRSLLNLAQTGFDGKSATTSRIRTDQLIWDVKRTIDMMYPENKVQLDLSLLPDNPEQLKIRGNEKLLHTALSNIIANACKYSNNDTVIVAIRSSADRVYIVVKDFGIGIPNNQLHQIWDPFFRASNAKNFVGYGIGLSLTKNIIRMHEGDVEVTSGENSGTSVEVSLPLDIITPAN